MRVRSFISGVIIILIVMSFLGCTEKINEPENEITGIVLTSPEEGVLLEGIVTLKAEVMERSEVSQVEFFVDGDSLAVDMESPYEVEWNTETAFNQTHSLVCRGILENSGEVLADTVIVAVRNLLFTANYIDYFQEEDEGYIYVSDHHGNILGEAGWTGNGTVEVEHSPVTGLIPDRFTVTRVHNYSQLNTSFAIPKGSVETYEMEEPLSEYHSVELNFLNIPENEGYSLANLWHASATDGILEGSRLFDFRDEPSDLLIKLNTVEFGEKYKWVYNVTEDSCEIDLAEMSYSDSSIIELDYGPYEFRYGLIGYPTPGSHKTGIGYYLDGSLGFDSGTSSFTMRYPSDTFTDYRTRINFYDVDDHNTGWSETAYGAIPETFIMYDVEYDLISNEPDNFQVQVTGDCDCVAIQWLSPERHIYWDVTGPPDYIDFSLPAPPATLLENMPELDVGLMEMYFLTLIDYSPCDSYDELLDLRHNSDEYFYDAIDGSRSRKIHFEIGSEVDGGGEFGD